MHENIINKSGKIYMKLEVFSVDGIFRVNFSFWSVGLTIIRKQKKYLNNQRPVSLFINKLIFYSIIIIE